MTTVLDLQRATRDARTRLNDESLALAVKQGKFQILRVVINGRKTDVTPLSDWLDIPAAIVFLQQYRPTPLRSKP